MRHWGEHHPSANDMAELDFSEAPGADRSGVSVGDDFIKALVDEHSLGARNSEGMYEIKDLDVNLSKASDEAIDGALRNLSLGKEPSTSTSNSTLSSLSGLFSRLTGAKVLTEKDLAPVLAGMKEHLMKKNVAKDIADKICEGVGESLVGRRIGGFEGMNRHLT